MVQSADSMLKNISKQIDESKAVIQPIILPNVNKNVNVFMKRIDLVHPEISGNKWFKMKYNIAEAKEKNYDTLLTFGGAYSNHIYSTSAAGKIFSFKTIGLIRGEEHLPINTTLKYAIDCGMKIHYVDRTTFRKRETPEFLEWIKNEFGDVYILPMGGKNRLAVKGCSEIINQIDIEYDYICSACGSGGTFSGLVAGFGGKKKAIGFSALKGGGFLKEDISNLVFDYTKSNYDNWEINSDYHFGGFAKLSLELINFMEKFKKLNGIELDYIYTGKLMYGIADLINKEYFKEGETIIALHSGGLQGNEGMKQKVDKILDMTKQNEQSA